jgi:hypothetical protein
LGWDSGDPIVELVPELDPIGRLRLLLEESVPWMGVACMQSILHPFSARATPRATVPKTVRQYYSPSNVDLGIAFTSLPSEAERMSKHRHLGATMAHRTKVYGILNPDFVEQLLGLPVGWSDALAEIRQDARNRRNDEE